MKKGRANRSRIGDREKPVSAERVKKLDRENRRLKARNKRLEDKLQNLEDKVRDLEAQLEEYRKKFFRKNKTRPEDERECAVPKKRGAPIGHPGTTRRRPNHVDEHVEVALKRCPECGGGNLSRCRRHEDHYQEDIVLPQVKVTHYRHHVYYCKDCKKTVQGIGVGEMPQSYIGPVAKSIAGFLHYQMGIPYRKIRKLFVELFHLDFDPSSCPGFDRQIRSRGQPLYEQLKKSLSKKPFIHADETGWHVDGINHWLHCHASMGAIVYTIDRSRGSKVVESVLGKKYSGVLISDFLSAYNSIKCRKQRCLVHLLRLIKKQLVYFEDDPKKTKYFLQLKALIKNIIELSRQTESEKLPKDFSVKKADLIGRLRRMLKCQLGHQKADKFLQKLHKHLDELVTCLDFAEVCAHNNWVERLLRGNPPQADAKSPSATAPKTACRTTRCL
jgi:transposase